jgi:pyruvate ferredoxin oxidoreductase alpha subunit
MKSNKLVPRTGNEVAAETMRQINPDVVAAYPITPATEVVQIFSEYVANGLVDTEFIAVESEHSAMSCCIGAQAAGARTITVTASQGLALMWEMLYIASGLRLPIVLINVNRTLSSPINIHCDHSDSFGARDSGWIQIYCENVQEVHDNLIQAVKIAETCLLPVMVCYDGFIISHGMEPVSLLEDEKVKQFIGEYQPKHTLIDFDNPKTFGAIDFTDYYFEHKMSQIDAMINSKSIIEKVSKEYSAICNRNYGLIEAYKLEDAKLCIVVLGSTAGTCKVVVDKLREEENLEVGLLKLRIFRPFPHEELIKLLKDKQRIAVLDRCDGLSGMGGPLFAEIRACLYPLNSRPEVFNYVYGLGGRDIDTELLTNVYKDLIKKPDKLINYIGVRSK